jgi:hypothetical protein
VSFNWSPNVIEVVIGAVLSLVGWAVRQALARVEENARKIAAIELSLAREYVRHDDLGDLKREQRRNGRMLAYIQLQLVALAARFSVRVEPFPHDGEDEGSHVAA